MVLVNYLLLIVFFLILQTHAHVEIESHASFLSELGGAIEVQYSWDLLLIVDSLLVDIQLMMYLIVLLKKRKYKSFELHKHF